jgi:hypothetical protein
MGFTKFTKWFDSFPVQARLWAIGLQCKKVEHSQHFDQATPNLPGAFRSPIADGYFFWP